LIFIKARLSQIRAMLTLEELSEMRKIMTSAFRTGTTGQHTGTQGTVESLPDLNVPLSRDFSFCDIAKRVHQASGDLRSRGASAEVPDG
jgi:hypothetical protein